MKSWHYTLATYIAGACLLVLLVHLQLSLVSGPAKSSGSGSRADPIRDADEYGGRTGADDNEGTWGQVGGGCMDTCAGGQHRGARA